MDANRVFRELLEEEYGSQTKKTVEDPVEQLYGSVKVTPEANPKKIVREWAIKRVDRKIS